MKSLLVLWSLAHTLSSFAAPVCEETLSGELVEFLSEDTETEVYSVGVYDPNRSNCSPYPWQEPFCVEPNGGWRYTHVRVWKADCSVVGL